MVTVCVLVTPLVTLPKLTDAGVTAICGWTPVPLSAIVVGEFVALLVRAMLPVALPFALGANAAVREADCPALSVSGSVRPVTLNPVPVTLSLESVTLPVPLFVRVTLFVVLLPTRTLPKLSEVAEEDNWSVCDTPVPARAKATDGVGELFARVSVPANVPAAEGSKLTVKEDDPPAEILRGSVNPE
jgi:hypothetical protein